MPLTLQSRRRASGLRLPTRSGPSAPGRAPPGPRRETTSARPQLLELRRARIDRGRGSVLGEVPIRVGSPGVHSKRTYDAPRFHARALRPRGSSTRPRRLLRADPLLARQRRLPRRHQERVEDEVVRGPARTVADRPAGLGHGGRRWRGAEVAQAALHRVRGDRRRAARRRAARQAPAAARAARSATATASPTTAATRTMPAQESLGSASSRSALPAEHRRQRP